MGAFNRGVPVRRVVKARRLAQEEQNMPYFHDGSAANLLAVVNHYDAVFSLGLTADQKLISWSS
jgi:hypothetical protein